MKGASSGSPGPLGIHFVNDPKAKELLKKVKGFKVTR